MWLRGECEENGERKQKTSKQTNKQTKKKTEREKGKRKRDGRKIVISLLWSDTHYLIACYRNAEVSSEVSYSRTRNLLHL